MFLNNLWLGVRIWIWLYFALSLIFIIVVGIWWYRESIRRKYYEIRFPEKLLKVVIHYKTGYFKEFYRLIPDKNAFSILGMDYHFTDKDIIRDNDFFVKNKKKKNSTVVKVEGKEYEINDLYRIRKKSRDYPEIHYFYNIPHAIKFEIKAKDIKLSAKQLNIFQENDLFAKLLTLDSQMNMFVFLILLGVVNAIISMIILAKMMEWIT